MAKRPTPTPKAAAPKKGRRRPKSGDLPEVPENPAPFTPSGPQPGCSGVFTKKVPFRTHPTCGGKIEPDAPASPGGSSLFDSAILDALWEQQREGLGASREKTRGQKFRDLACSPSPKIRAAVADKLEPHEVLFLLSDLDVKVREAAVSEGPKSPGLSELLVALAWNPFTGFPTESLDDQSAVFRLREALLREMYAYQGDRKPEPYHTRGRVALSGIAAALGKPFSKLREAALKAAAKVGIEPQTQQPGPDEPGFEDD